MLLAEFDVHVVGIGVLEIADINTSMGKKLKVPHTDSNIRARTHTHTLTNTLAQIVTNKSPSKHT